MTDPTSVSDDFDAGTYGRSFADVYDSWYPMESDTSAAVGYLHGLAGPTRRILEVGVGTGRIAIPLATLGHAVCGMDSSAEMLSVLADKATESGVHVDSITGDVCDDGSWPTGPFGLVVAAYNFVFNLIGDDAKRRFIHNAADALEPEGLLVIESHLPAVAPEPLPDDGIGVGSVDGRAVSERRVELKEMSFDSVVLIASETNHSTGVVVGQHIELRDGEPVRLRPWKVHVTTPDRLDALAIESGLRPVNRLSGWDGSPFGADSYRAVSVYRRPG